MIIKRGDIFYADLRPVIGSEPVSYTHLDVYKRQEQFQNGYSGYERFRQILDMEPEIKDKEGAKELTNVVGNIKFDDVSFRYNDNDHRVLKHINLEITAGSYIALVGSSGAGKTTLCNLIPRFYDVTKGSISICLLYTSS